MVYRVSRPLCLALLVGLLVAGSVRVVAQPAPERGTAERYPPGALGMRTASGERYAPERATLAHATLPFGTLVEVTHLVTGRRVVARVNDRPPAGGPVARLSARAADRLGLGMGPTMVGFALPDGEALAARAVPPPAPPSAGFTVQLGLFSDAARAAARAAELPGAWVLPTGGADGPAFRVCAGRHASYAAAAAHRDRLRAQGLEGFVQQVPAGTDGP